MNEPSGRVFALGENRLYSRPLRYSTFRFLAIAVAIVCAVGTITIFRALQSEQRRHVERMTHLAADAIKADLVADMESRSLAEARFAKMWERDDLTRRNWDLNASLLMMHHPGSLAVFWLNTSGHVVWATYKNSNPQQFVAIPNQQLVDVLATLAATNQSIPVLSHIFSMPDGKALRWSVTSFSPEEEDGGYVAVLYDARESLASMLHDVRGLGYGLIVEEQATNLYSLAGNSVPLARVERTSVQLPGDSLNITVWPTPETLEELGSHLPEAALMIAVTLSLLVTLAIRLASVARVRSLELQITNDQLQVEVRQRERIEQALRRSRARFAAILDMSGDAIVCTSECGKITLFNESAERMFNLDAEEIIGSGVDRILVASGDTADERADEARARKAVAFLRRTNHIRARRSDDSEFPADVTVSILNLEQEKIVTIILRDVSERHVMESELRTAHGQLEMRVAERTQQLADSVCQLEAEINLRNEAENSLRELSARILQLQDSERRRIARELHDSTAQVLVAAFMNVAAIRDTVADNSATVADLAKDTAQLIEQAQNEIRTISYLLHPPLLEELGLASAIDWYATGFSKRSGIQVSLNLAPDLGRLPREYELTLFRIVQEALTNVHRHSRSRTAQIRLARNSDSIRLEIADQGAGVPESKLRALENSGASLGVGLAGMRERMRQLGGGLSVSSSSAGTVIAAHIAFTNKEDDGAGAAFANSIGPVLSRAVAV